MLLLWYQIQCHHVWTETRYSSHRCTIKLGLITLVTKALDNDGGYFTSLCNAFPGLTIEKLKAGIFDAEFEDSTNEVELEAWNAFVLVVKNCLGNNKARNYAELGTNMLTAF